jgi:hypothetical protein
MSYEHYYLQQAGNGLPAYAGVPFQRGHGLGSIIGGLFRGALPILRNVGKAVGKQLLRSGLDVANDVVSGNNVKKALKRRAREGAANLLGGQRGSGVGGVHKKRRVTPKRNSSRKATTKRGRKRIITPDIFT